MILTSARGDATEFAARFAIDCGSLTPIVAAHTIARR
jgi:hypothetical protein